MPCWFIFKVHLELLYCPFNANGAFANPFDQQFSMTSLERTIKNTQNGTPNGSSLGNKTLSRRKEVITRGVLSVTVVSAEDLPAMDIAGKSDPYVVLNMKKAKTKHKTRVRVTVKWINISYFFHVFFLISDKDGGIFRINIVGHSKNFFYQLQVVNSSLNPTWDQTFDFVVEDGLHDMLILEVWDHDTFGKVCFLLKCGYYY